MNRTETATRRTKPNQTLTQTLFINVDSYKKIDKLMTYFSKIRTILNKNLNNEDVLKKSLNLFIKILNTRWVKNMILTFKFNDSMKGGFGSFIKRKIRALSIKRRLNGIKNKFNVLLPFKKHTKIFPDDIHHNSLSPVRKDDSRTQPMVEDINYHNLPSPVRKEDSRTRLIVEEISYHDSPLSTRSNHKSSSNKSNTSINSNTSLLSSPSNRKKSNPQLSKDIYHKQLQDLIKALITDLNKNIDEIIHLLNILLHDKIKYYDNTNIWKIYRSGIQYIENEIFEILSKIYQINTHFQLIMILLNTLNQILNNNQQVPVVLITVNFQNYNGIIEYSNKDDVKEVKDMKGGKRKVLNSTKKPSKKPSTVVKKAK